MIRCTESDRRASWQEIIDGERVRPAIDGAGIGEFKEFAVPKHLLADGTLHLTFDCPSSISIGVINRGCRNSGCSRGEPFRRKSCIDEQLAVREGATASWLRFPIDQAIG